MPERLAHILFVPISFGKRVSRIMWHLVRNKVRNGNTFRQAFWYIHNLMQLKFFVSAFVTSFCTVSNIFIVISIPFVCSFILSYYLSCVRVQNYKRNKCFDLHFYAPQTHPMRIYNKEMNRIKVKPNKITPHSNIQKPDKSTEIIFEYTKRKTT